MKEGRKNNYNMVKIKIKNKMDISKLGILIIKNL